MHRLELFINYILPLIVLLIGLIGNTLGFGLLLSKRLTNLPTRKLYFYLLFIDSTYILQIVLNYLENNFKFSLTVQSVAFCKFFSFFNYSFASLSPMLLVYISIDRLISIKFPEHRFILRNNKTQILYLLFIITFNFIYYFPFALVLNVFTRGEYAICSIGNDYFDSVLLIMDLLNRVCVPFTLMSFSSVLLVVTIFKSRTRVFRDYLSKENKLFKRDIKLAITSLSLNVIYMLLNLPITIAEFMDLNDYTFYNLNLWLYYLSYAINFFIILISNSLIRSQVLNLFGFRNKSCKN